MKHKVLFSAVRNMELEAHPAGVVLLSSLLCYFFYTISILFVIDILDLPISFLICLVLSFTSLAHSFMMDYLCLSALLSTLVLVAYQIIVTVLNCDLPSSAIRWCLLARRDCTR